MATLVNFQQGKWETLKEYLFCFNALTFEIKDLNEGILIHQVIMGLWVGHFFLFLDKKLTIALFDLLASLEKYINAEEIEMAWWQVDKK